MPDMSKVLGTYAVAIDAFNRGDLDPFTTMIADECTFETSIGVVGGTRDEIVERMRLGRSPGWESHNILATLVAGEFMLEAYRNDDADGTSHIGAGVVRVGEDGRLTEIRTLETAEAVVAARARMSGAPTG